MASTAEEPTPAWPGPLGAWKGAPKVTIDLSGDLITDPESEPKLRMAPE
jgi:hypothetical protein